MRLKTKLVIAVSLMVVAIVVTTLMGLVMTTGLGLWVTGRLNLITGAMAREIIIGKDGRAEAVSYIDKATRSENKISAKAFVIGASACESARLLLNSKSSMSPDGVA